MPNRITGLNSGLDTEALVNSLVSSHQKKVDNLTFDQKRFSWKQDAWKGMNKEIVDFYNGVLDSMSSASNYSKKVTTASNANAVTIITGDTAMNATQRMKVNKLASNAYMTGAEIKGKNDAKVDGSTKLSQLKDISFDASGNAKLTVNVGSKPVELTFNENDTINDVVTKLKGVNANGQKYNANFDAGYGRIYMAANTTGEAGSFSFDDGGNGLLSALGMQTVPEGTKYEDLSEADKAKYANLSAGSNAEIELNGVKYTSDSGTFEINGLTITANEVTDNEFTVTTKQDTSGIYDMIKDLFKKYNELIIKMDTNYNADSAAKYKMLSDEEKEAMSEDEVKEWEQKIKDGLLSKDETLRNVAQAMKDAMAGAFSVAMKDGSSKELYLSDFGINTLSYFSAKENEHYAYHIDGDPDDDNSKTNADKLKSMIASDPDAVSSFFAQMSRKLRSNLLDLMGSTEYSSSYTVYEDKLMASQYSAYNTKIADATEKLNAKMDQYYAKFTRMEKAMAKLNSTQTNLSGYFGGGG